MWKLLVITLFFEFNILVTCTKNQIDVKLELNKIQDIVNQAIKKSDLMSKTKCNCEKEDQKPSILTKSFRSY